MMKYLVACVIALLITWPMAAQEVVIKAAKVYSQNGAPLSPGAVHVRDGKVIGVAAEIAPPPGVKVIDLGTGTLIPGLVDAHNTLGIEGGTSEQTSEITPSFHVLDGIDWSARAFRLARSEGTSTVALAPGTENVI